MRLGKSLIALALAANILAAMPTQAKTILPGEGGPGDHQTLDECPAGSYMVGFNGRVGSWVDQLQILCGAVNNRGQFDAKSSEGPLRGGNTGGFLRTECNVGEAISSINVYYTENRRQVKQIRYSCSNARDTYLRVFGGVDDANLSRTITRQSCSSGEFPIGLSLSWGRHVNSIALICDRFSFPKPPTGTSFIGSWDTVTNQGARYEIVLSEGDGVIEGRFILIGGPQIYSGTMQGKLESNGTGLRFTYRQNNGATGKGIFGLSADGRMIDGVGTANNPPQIFTWKGTRK